MKTLKFEWFPLVVLTTDLVKISEVVLKMNINWKVRFSRDNMLFIVRFISALFIPVLVAMDLELKDLNTWAALRVTILDFLANPYLIGLVILNAINILPDPTTKGLSDSEQALQYKKPGGKE